MDEHMEAVVSDKYPNGNFINCSICYKYIDFNTKDRNFGTIFTIIPYGGTTSGNM